jgi:hypothetical protein
MDLMKIILLRRFKYQIHDVILLSFCGTSLPRGRVGRSFLFGSAF